MLEHAGVGPGASRHQIGELQFESLGDRWFGTRRTVHE
jgi:hypothetical protein